LCQLLAASGRETQRQRAGEKEAGYGFLVAANRAGTRGDEDDAGATAEDIWLGGKGKINGRLNLARQLSIR
jgi:hypothetical protein